MENRITEITSKENKAVKIGIIPGHFATNHSHVNYYVDLTGIKTSHAMAIEAASVLAQSYLSGLSVDTIICLEGTEMLGAFFAQKLADAGINSNKDIAVLTPELNSNNQMIFASINTLMIQIFQSFNLNMKLFLKLCCLQVLISFDLVDVRGYPFGALFDGTLCFYQTN